MKLKPIACADPDVSVFAGLKGTLIIKSLIETTLPSPLTVSRAHRTQRTRTSAVPAQPPTPGEQRLVLQQRPVSPGTHSNTARDAAGTSLPRPFSAHESLNLLPPTLGLQAPEAHSPLCTKAPPFNSASPTYFCYFINWLPVVPPKVVRCKYDPPGPCSPLFSSQGSCSSPLATFPVPSRAPHPFSR